MSPFQYLIHSQFFFFCGLALEGSDHVHLLLNLILNTCLILFSKQPSSEHWKESWWRKQQRFNSFFLGNVIKAFGLTVPDKFFIVKNHRHVLRTWILSGYGFLALQCSKQTRQQVGEFSLCFGQQTEANLPCRLVQMPGLTLQLLCKVFISTFNSRLVFSKSMWEFGVTDYCFPPQKNDQQRHRHFLVERKCVKTSNTSHWQIISWTL